MTGNWYCKTIICVDDEESVLESYQQILTTSEEDTELADILALADERSGKNTASDSVARQDYTLLLADSGAKAVQLVRDELAAGRRIAAGFFDMRMPGMDGYETIKAIRELDRDLVCTVVTAYTDRSVNQIRELFHGDSQDQLLYFKKPFAPEELEQSALNMVSAWNNKRRLEEYMRAVEMHKQGLSHILHAVGVLSCVPPHSLQSLITGLLFEFMAFLEAEDGYAVFSPDKDGPKHQYGVGEFENQQDLCQIIDQESIFQMALTTNQCQIVGNQCFVPLVSKDYKFGGMYIKSKKALEMRADRNLLEIFKTQMVQLMLNSLYHQQAVISQEEAFTDPLTGLYNRRFLIKVLHDELQNSMSPRIQLAVLMVDLDDFKKVNDTYGHDAGDMALRKVGNVLRFAVRNSDLLGLGRDLEHIGKTEQYALRMGGEEFCVVLVNTGVGGAQIVGERIRKNIAEGGFVYRDVVIPLTASVGIWSGEIEQLDPENEDLLSAYIDRADQALYRAKATGKNRVEVYVDDAT